MLNAGDTSSGKNLQNIHVFTLILSWFSSHILISDHQFSYYSEVISLLSKLIIFVC